MNALTVNGQAHLKFRLTREEGVRLKPYKDSKGIWTIGVGHNLEVEGLDPKVVYLQFQIDLEKKIADAATLPAWHVSNEARKTALVELVFWMGLTRFRKFRHTLKAWEQRDWQTAHDELLDSKTGRNPKLRPRLEEIANIVLTGRYEK